MARFIVTKDSYFQPFTYEQLEKPILEMQTAHNASQDAYDQLMAGTMSLENYISKNPEDSDAKALYDNYKTKLSNLQNNLWENGYNSQTRRDLATARMGFSSDIGRLSKAIERRQQVSKEWADMMKKNPNLVAEDNPGLAGLNEYLRNDRYGDSWWNYDKSQFEKEVGTDALNMAKELQRQYSDPHNVVKNSSLPAVLTRIINKGFTSKETGEAGEVVDNVLGMDASQRKAYYAQNSISEPVQVLAEAFVNRYNSTGAATANLSDASRKRFISSGKAGFNYGILEPDVKDFNDPTLDLALKRQQLKNEQLKQRIIEGKLRPEPSKNKYNFNSPILNRRSAVYDTLQKITKGKYKGYEGNKTYSFIGEDGSSSEVNDPWAMSRLVYNTEEREKTRKNFGGIDLALGADTRQIGSIGRKSGRRTTVIADRLSRKQAADLGLTTEDVGIFDVNGKLLESETKLYNEKRRDHLKKVQDIKERNRSLGVDVDSIAITPEEQYDIYRKFDLTAANKEHGEQYGQFSDDDLYNILMGKSVQGTYSPAVLVGMDESFNTARRNYGRLLIDKISQGIKDAKRNKANHYGVYKIDSDSGRVSDKAETNLSSIFGTKDPSKIDSGMITFIGATPSSMTGDSPRIIFSTKANPGVFYETSIDAVGDMVRNQFAQGIGGTDVSSINLLKEAMLPLDSPQEVLTMSDKESKQIGEEIFSLLADPDEPESYENLLVIDGGSYRIPTAKEIARDPRLQESLENAIILYMNKQFSVPRDAEAKYHPQRTGGTSKDPLTFLPATSGTGESDDYTDIE